MMKIGKCLILSMICSTATFAQETKVKAQSTDEQEILVQDEAITLELIAVFNDAVDAPTEFNEYVIPYLERSDFPLNKTNTKSEFDQLIREWIESNPKVIEQFHKDRQVAHDKLYGPRKKG